MKKSVDRSFAFLKVIFPIILIVVLSACSSEKDKSSASEKDENSPENNEEMKPILEEPLYLIGKISDNMRITMVLNETAKGIEGTYQYMAIGKDIELLEFSVETDEDGIELTLDEFNNNKKTGTFEGEITNGKYAGTWRSPNGNSYPFSLDIVSLDDLQLIVEEEESKKIRLDPDMSHPLDACISSEELENLVLTDSVMSDWEDSYEPRLAQRDWESLSMESRLLHCFKYMEDFEQNCAPSPAYKDNQLFYDLPFGDGEAMSDRQYGFIKENKSFVVDKLMDCIGKTHELDFNYFNVLLQLDAYESIPMLTGLYREGHITNTYVLTLMIEFMREYQPYLDWNESVGLFDPPSDLSEEENEMWGMYGLSVDLTEEIEHKILELSEDFYSNEVDVE